jgi:hypothetical protein
MTAKTGKKPLKIMSLHMLYGLIMGVNEDKNVCLNSELYAILTNIVVRHHELVVYNDMAQLFYAYPCITYATTINCSTKP